MSLYKDRHGRGFLKFRITRLLNNFIKYVLTWV